MKQQEFTTDPCNLCPRNCRVHRQEGEKGYCMSDHKLIAARAALHMWEEPCISGKTGSGTVFFSQAVIYDVFTVRIMRSQRD